MGRVQTRGSLIAEQALPQLEKRCLWTIKIFCSSAALMCTVPCMLVFGLCVFKVLVLKIYPCVHCAPKNCIVASEWGSCGWSGILHAANWGQERVGIVLRGLQRSAAVTSGNANMLSLGSCDGY